MSRCRCQRSMKCGRRRWNSSAVALEERAAPRVLIDGLSRAQRPLHKCSKVGFGQLRCSPHGATWSLDCRGLATAAPDAAPTPPLCVIDAASPCTPNASAGSIKGRDCRRIGALSKRLQLSRQATPSSCSCQLAVVLQEAYHNMFHV
eukprot:356547-Chlamydomonas_euryale.AAC.2